MYFTVIRTPEFTGVWVLETRENVVQFLVAESHGEFIVENYEFERLFKRIIMKLNSFSPIPEDDAELHLPELVYWASLGDVEQVEQLLTAGTDPNQTDDEAYSALQAAAENDNLAVVKLLVSKGANVAYKGEYTALQLAEMAEHSEVVAYLKSL